MTGWGDREYFSITQKPGRSTKFPISAKNNNHGNKPDFLFGCVSSDRAKIPNDFYI